MYCVILCVMSDSRVYSPLKSVFPSLLSFHISNVPFPSTLHTVGTDTVGGSMHLVDL